MGMGRTAPMMARGGSDGDEQSSGDANPSDHVGNRWHLGKMTGNDGRDGQRWAALLRRQWHGDSRHLGMSLRLVTRRRRS